MKSAYPGQLNLFNGWGSSIRRGTGGVTSHEQTLQEIAASGRTAADELLGRYHGDWGGDLDRVYAEYSY